MLKEITAHQQGVLKGLDCTMQCCTLPGCHWLDWERNILCCFLSEIVLCIGLGSAHQSVLFWVSPWVSQKFPVFSPWLQVVLGWSIMFGIVACCKPSRRKTWESVKKTLGLLGPCWWDFLVGPWHSASTCSWKKSNVYPLWKGVPVGHVHLVPTRVADDRWWKMRGTHSNSNHTFRRTAFGKWSRSIPWSIHIHTSPRDNSYTWAIPKKCGLQTGHFSNYTIIPF